MLVESSAIKVGDHFLDFKISIDSYGYPRSIQIPERRKKILFENGFKNIFEDKTIFDSKCEICVKEKGFHKTRGNKAVQYFAIHLVSNYHKIDTPLSVIIDNLRKVEYFSLQKQRFNFDLLKETQK